MPVRNAAPYLDEAIESILRQSFTDFEFVIRDDRSTDGSLEIIRKWAARDSRIRAFEGEQLGLSDNSNWIVHEARAPIVARMDADDVARPDRLEQQLGVLNAAPRIDLVGSLYSVIDSRGTHILPVARWRLGRETFYHPFPHTSAMFRKSAFLAAGGYRPQCIYWEDLDLFLRMSEAGGIAVISEPLVSYRISDAGVRTVSDSVKFEREIDKSVRCLNLFRAGGSYDHLLDAPAASKGTKVHPYVFLTRGSAALWDKAPVRVLGGMWKRAALRFNLTSLQCLGWAVWARLSPGSLRFLLRSMHRLRNATSAGIAPGTVYEWRPGKKARPLALASAERPAAPAADAAQIAPAAADPQPVRY
jgi:glycosyltransferase involved in cell wall biosynthesis